MFNPNRSRDVGRLRKAFVAASKFMEPYRKARHDALRQYAGHGEHPGASTKEIPVNLIEMFVGTVTRFLAARSPTIRAETKIPALKSTARKIEMMSSQLLRELRFEVTQQRMVKDAHFGLGVIKTGLNVTDKGESWRKRIGDPFADNVSLDDFLFDHSARNWGEISWAMNRFRLPLDVARDEGRFDKKVREELKQVENRFFNDESGTERAESIGHGIFWDTDEYEPHVELRDVWFPREGLYVTLSEQGNKPLMVREWDAHPSGPYHILSFNDVPDNIMPVSPVSLIADLHSIMNHMVSKCADQASRQKTILGATGAAHDDAFRTVKAQDGDVLRISHRDGFKETKFGGVDQATLAFTMQVREWFNWSAGNIEVLAGLASAADTATQEQMLSRSSSRRIEDMQEHTESAIREVVESLIWYDYHDPILKRRLEMKLFGGPDGSVEIPFGPNDRMEDFLGFNIKIEPYSMQHVSPQAALQQLMGALSSLAPYIPLMQQQGATIDFHALTKEMGRLMPGMPDISEFIVFQDDPDTGDGSGMAHRQTQSPTTHRITERRGSPGGTPAGRNAALQQSLMSASGQSQTGGGQF